MEPEQIKDPDLTLLDGVLTAVENLPVAASGANGFSLSGRAFVTLMNSMMSQVQSLPKGLRVASLLPDAPMTAFSMLVLCHHAQLLPVNPALTDSEIEQIMRDANVQLLLSAPHDQRAAQLAAKLDLALALICEDGALILPKITAPDTLPGLILLTSGSTAAPKRVPLTPAQLHASAQRIATTLDLGPHDRAVHALPMFHIGAVVDLLLAPLKAGGGVHFAGGMDARSLHDSVTRHACTWLQLVPTMLARMQADLNADQLAQMGAGLRFVRSVSSDLAPVVQMQAETALDGTPIIQMYGMTETAGQITSNPLPPQIRKPGSAGRATGVDLRIEQGEVQVRGPSVTRGYEGLDPTEYVTPDGWLRTGDLGYLDADGFLFLTGRVKEMINRGGEKISPHEIEHAALACHGVIEAAAFARAHPSLGQEVGLAVTLAEGTTQADVMNALKTRLAGFKCPRALLVLKPLPRLGSGKIDRRALAALQAPIEPDTSETRHQGTAALIAQAWRGVLVETPDTGPAPDLDFFDAGGDSLAGAQFLFEAERLTGRSLPANLLYEAPIFQDFVAAVESVAPVSPTTLDDPKHAFLQTRLQDWDGDPVPDAPFFRVIGVDTQGVPLFWCAQEDREYLQLAQAFAGERPLYLMRSLFLMLGKDDTMNRALADDYAQAIQRIRPDGVILLGGFCEGAKIMRFAAETLMQAGRDVRVLISWDQWFTEPLALPVLHLWSDDRYARYSADHLFPERAIAPAHPAGYEVIRVPGGHTQVLTEGPLAPYLAQMRAAMAHGIAGAPASGTSVFDDAVQGRLTVSCPRFPKRGTSFTARITLSNIGARDWHASEDEPLYLTAQLHNLDGHIRTRRAAGCRLCQTVCVDQSITALLEIDMPTPRVPMWLSVDLVDGASHSARACGLKAPRKLLFPNPF